MVSPDDPSLLSIIKSNTSGIRLRFLYFYFLLCVETRASSPQILLDFLNIIEMELSFIDTVMDVAYFITSSLSFSWMQMYLGLG